MHEALSQRRFESIFDTTELPFTSRIEDDDGGQIFIFLIIHRYD